MVLDGVCYPVIHFCRVILYVWCNPLFVVSLSLACNLGGTYVRCVAPDATLLMIRSVYNISKTISPSLWRGCINALVQ